MSDPGSASRTGALRLEEVAHAAAELAAERELDSLLARFLDRVREWAGPSALLSAVKDPAAEGGWRLLPSLSFGSGPLGAERTLPGLIEDTPGCLERPTSFQPGGTATGVQARDNCIVPWVHEGDSGVLVLRGIPRPSAPNLGEALTVLAAPVWPRLLGGPAARMESMVGELRRVAERLEEDARRHLERLQASAPPVATEGGEEAARRASELEGQLESLRQERQQAVAERDGLRERLVALETALAEAERERDRVLSERKGLESREKDAAERTRVAEEGLKAAKEELEAARTEGEHSTLEWDELKGRVAALQEALGEAEAARDGARNQAQRLTARIESLQAEQASSTEEAVASVKKELEAARAEVERITKETEALKDRLAPVEEARKKAESERDEARAAVARLEEERRTAEESTRDVEEARRKAEGERDEARAAVARLEEERRSAGDSARNAEETLTTTQRELVTAREEEHQANAEAGALRALVASLEKTLQETEAERDGARGKAEILEEQKDVAEAAARTAEEALTSLREQLAEAKKAAAAAGGESGEKASALLRDTLGVLRRTPFVPPGLRVSMEEGRRVVGGEEERPEPWLRLALLDRDAASVEPLVEELEAEGLEVKIANYPEELALLMKTPAAKKLDVAVCDVLAFRPDQTVAGLFRGWEKDRPGLAFFLSFNSEDAGEAERAKRVPMSLTAGRLPRPIPANELIEKLRVLVQKQEAVEE